MILRRSRLLLVSTFLLLGACGGDDDGVGDDADASIVGGEPDAALAIDAAPSPDAPETPVCGGESLPTGQITGTEGLAIAPDGTLYYSQSGSIGRRRPGMAPEDDWVTVASNTIYGLAYDDASGMLYVAAVTAQKIFQIDTTIATPEATVLFSPAPGANGIVIGPDGAIYYSSLGGGNEGGHLFRVGLDGQRTAVTTSKIDGGPNGIFFEDDHTLLALSYGNGEVYAVTLDAAMKESGRVKLADVGNQPDGIARDREGRWYIGENGDGELLRYAPDWTGGETLLPNVPSAANVVFGRGVLDCNDVYVASGGALGVYHLE